MSCMTHDCPTCGEIICDNERSHLCPKCGDRMTATFDEEPDRDDWDDDDEDEDA